MHRFESYGVARVIFGRGEFGRVGQIAGGIGQSALIVHSASAPAGRLDKLLSDAGVRSFAVQQRAEPVVEDVDAAVQAARRHDCNVLIGMGGGSAIDAAKAAAGLLANGGTALDYLEVVGKGQKLARPSVPWIAIPTTAGTGAEATRNAVIGVPERRFKASMRSELLLPRVAIVDPELGVSVPPAVTAASGMDALCQCIESFTSTGATPITDSLALRGIGLAARSLRRAYDDGTDIDAREDMALAALLSGIALTSAGLGAVHGFAAPLGANFPVPHGTTCAALLPGVIRANIDALRREPLPQSASVLARYADVGRCLLQDDAASDAPAIEACSTITAELARQLRIPPLSQFGIVESNAHAMVMLARKASSMRYNPILLPDAELERILIDAIRVQR